MSGAHTEEDGVDGLGKPPGDHRVDRATALLDTALLDRARFYMKRELNSNLSSNEVYYTACSLLVILQISCNQLHHPKVLN